MADERAVNDWAARCQKCSTAWRLSPIVGFEPENPWPSGIEVDIQCLECDGQVRLNEGTTYLVPRPQ